MLRNPTATAAVGIQQHRNMEGRTIVITGLNSWGCRPRSNAQSLAREFSRANRVLYVNPPSDISVLLGGCSTVEKEHKSRVLRGSEPAIRRINSNLWVLEPPIIVSAASKIYSDVVFDFLNRRNNRRYGEVILWAMNYLGMSDITLVIDNDVFRSFYLNEYLEPDMTLYYRNHNLPSLPYWKYHGQRLEPLLVKQCDAVITSNEILAQSVRPYNSYTFNVGQGAETDGYDPQRRYAVPTDVACLPRPIIGSTGTFGVLLHDPNLIYRIATSLPSCSIVLIGNEDSVFMRHSLHRLPNVHFLGPRSESELPAYVASFDACFNPETRNDVTSMNYQSKIVSWLAMGKRIVATETDPMGIFYRNVYLARDEQDFVRLLHLALAAPARTGEKERRTAFARSLSWNNCAERIYTVMDMLDDEFEYLYGDFFEDEDALFS